MKRNTLYYGDCLEVMRAWPDACVDLIYLDPPFNSSADYNILFGNQKAQTGDGEVRRKDLAQMVAFTDTWEWSEKTAERIREIRRSHAHRARKAIVALDSFYQSGTGMLAYLVYMADRIDEMHRVLKDSGALYLHCDPTASHYLKMILDAVFGAGNFRNEIVWKRKQDTHNLATKQMGRVHDVILWYGKSRDAKYRKQFTAYSPEYVDSAYKHEDAKGRYRTLPCTNEAGGNKPYQFHGMTRAWRFTKEKMQAMFDEGLLVQATPESPFQYKKYLDDAAGVPVQDIWADIKAVRGKGENLDYPTQKPLALLERIIKASSEQGALVLDPFCGCGTTVEAAMKLQRDFIGIDISMYALDVIQKERLQNVTFQIDGVPTDMQTASHMAAHQPFAFEKWAVHRIPGFVANNKQPGDGGIDGWGGLLHPPEDEDGICIAQVKSGKPSADAIRAFASQLTAGYASAGVFITLKKWDTPTARKCIAGAGTLQQGASEFNRLVMWSVEEYFAGVKPNLPPLAHPRTGRPLQEDWMVSETAGLFDRRAA